MTDKFELMIVLLVILVSVTLGFFICIVITPSHETLCIERTCPENKYSEMSEVCMPTSCHIPDNATITNAIFNVNGKQEQPCK